MTSLDSAKHTLSVVCLPDGQGFDIGRATGLNFVEMETSEQKIAMLGE